MGFFEWNERIMRKISERNLTLIINGNFLATFMLGSLFSHNLVLYGYFILIGAALVLLQYTIHGFIQWYRKKKVSYKFHLLGFSGVFLLLLFLGIQSPQIPFKIYFLSFGVLLTIPAYIDVFRRKR